jgi:hypothetical protein
VGARASAAGAAAPGVPGGRVHPRTPSGGATHIEAVPPKAGKLVTGGEGDGRPESPDSTLNAADGLDMDTDDNTAAAAASVAAVQQTQPRRRGKGKQTQATVQKAAAAKAKTAAAAKAKGPAAGP